MKLPAIILLLLLAMTTCLACNKIETGKTLNKKTLHLIKSMGMLDEGEQILFYYSNYKERRAGSFITNKRIGHYWIDDRKEKSDTTFAYYNDIIAIDTMYDVADFDCPYIQIMKKDSSVFRAYAKDHKERERLFFEKAIELWKSKKP